MLVLPSLLQSQFDERLRLRAIPDNLQGDYRKWLRFYLEFCLKYHWSPRREESLAPFLRNLQDIRLSEGQREQAAKAIALYYDILTESGRLGMSLPYRTTAGTPALAPSSYALQPSMTAAPEPLSETERVAEPSSVSFASLTTSKDPLHSEKLPDVPAEEAVGTDFLSLDEERTVGSSWKAEYARLTDEIQIRHYSAKTLKTYRGWARRFQAFTKSKTPEALSTDDVKAFLAFLADKRKVSASTQNQAFNALLFFYRHALGREFGKVDGVVRAKRKPSMPVVLSREEIDVLLANLEPPCDLVVKLLYGCGLKLYECLGLRVHCLNFDAGLLAVHDGKGGKGRSVPLPQAILPELRAHLEFLQAIHRRDLEKGYAGVFLVNALERQHRHAAREFAWQWLFPAKHLTLETETGAYRRYHLHETHVRKAIRQAVLAARIPKRVTAHVFRHSFAGHLLRRNYDIRTIAELLGHSDVRTTMIYKRTEESATIKEARSPLDFDRF